MSHFYRIAVIIFVLGVFCIPTQVLACENMQEKCEMACCKKIKTVDHYKKVNSKKKSASNNQTSKENNTSKKGCGDDCHQNECQCAPNCLVFTLPSDFILENKTFNNTKTSLNTTYTKSFISSRFLSIWLPPKLV